AQRTAQRFATIVTRYDHRLLASHRRDETLELEAQRLTLGRFEWNALDEGLERERTFRQRRQVEITAQPIELAVARGEVEGQIPTLLEDATLPHSLARYTTRGNVGDDARVERKPCIRDVDEWREHRNPNGRHVCDVTPDEREHQVDAVHHQASAE